MNIRVADLRDTIAKNRIKHMADYNEAKAKFAENVIARLEEMLERARDGKFEQSVNLPAPQSHETDYDTVLRMLSLSADEIVTLTYQEFRQYVEDEWSWKRAFSTSNDTNAIYHAETTVRKRKL